jgi:hypothetical protein
MKVNGIMKKFEGFTDGYRLIMLLERSKEGGNNKDGLLLLSY